MMTTTSVYPMNIIVTGVGTFSGNVVFNQLKLDGNHNGEVTYDVSIQSAGVMAFVAS